MVLPKSPKACTIKINSLKKQVTAMEKRKKALSAAKKPAKKKAVKRKAAKRKPAKRKKRR